MKVVIKSITDVDGEVLHGHNLCSAVSLDLFWSSSSASKREVVNRPSSWKYTGVSIKTSPDGLVLSTGFYTLVKSENVYYNVSPGDFRQFIKTRSRVL